MAQKLNGSVLAYLGDSVLELMMRKSLTSYADFDTGALSRAEHELVSAHVQSECVDDIINSLTERELEVYKLGRNRKTDIKPKSSTALEYRRATGYEALFGFLYLENDTERASELFDISYTRRIEQALKVKK